MKTKTPVMHTTQYPISALGCNIPVMGNPMFLAQCNWTRHFHEVKPELFYNLLAGQGSEEEKVSYTENMGIIDTITQSVMLRYDLNGTTQEEQMNFDALVAALITERLIQMGILPKNPPVQENHENPFDNFGEGQEEEEGYQ